MAGTLPETPGTLTRPASGQELCWPPLGLEVKMTMEQAWHAATWKPGGGARLEAEAGGGGPSIDDSEDGGGGGGTGGSWMEAKWPKPPLRAEWLACVRPEMLEELEPCPFVALVPCPASKPHMSKSLLEKCSPWHGERGSARPAMSAHVGVNAARNAERG